MAEMLNCRYSPRSSPGAAKRRRPPGEVVEILSAPLETLKKDVDGGNNERMRAGTTKRRSVARATHENENRPRPQELVDPKIVSNWPDGPW